MSLVPTPRMGLEMVLLRMLAFTPAGVGVSSVPHDKPPSVASRQLPPQGERTKDRAIANRDYKPHDKPPSVASRQLPPQGERTKVSKSTDQDWATTVAELNLRGAGAAIAEHCTLTKIDEHEIHLALNKSHAVMLNDNLIKRLEQALNEYFGQPRKLTINLTENLENTPAAKQQAVSEKRQESATNSISKDQNVQAIIDAFDAKIIPDSTQPLDN